MTTTITLDKMRFYAFHGVMEQERTVGNWFEVSVRLRYPFEQAMADDCLPHTLNYAEAYDVVKSEMATPSRLLEHVAGRIKSALCTAFPAVEGGYIAIRKMKPPMPGIMEAAGVEVEW